MRSNQHKTFECHKKFNYFLTLNFVVSWSTFKKKQTHNVKFSEIYIHVNSLKFLPEKTTMNCLF